MFHTGINFIYRGNEKGLNDPFYFQSEVSNLNQALSGIFLKLDMYLIKKNAHMPSTTFLEI